MQVIALDEARYDDDSSEKRLCNPFRASKNVRELLQNHAYTSLSHTRSEALATHFWDNFRRSGRCPATPRFATMPGSPMSTVRSVTIVGVGLIGGSIGLALRARGLAQRVVGYGSRAETLEAALALGAISEIAVDATRAAASELIVVCAPVDHIVEQVCQLAPLCAAGTLFTDAGSTKATIVRQLEAAMHEPNWPAGVRFVGSHPLAGNEKKGPQAASAQLFEGRAVVLTPTPASPAEDLARLRDFWGSLGAKVLEMPPAQHDAALAVTSHLPHVVAAAIAGLTPERYVTLTAGGWQDTTRIAAGDPALWRQIMLSNRENLLSALDDFRGLIDTWRQALAAQDGEQLERLLKEAKRIRDAVGS